MNRKNANRNPKSRLIVAIVSIPFGLLLFGCDGKGKRELDVLKQFAADTPRYEDFKQVSSFEQHSPGTALFVVCYDSSASLNDVIAFYSHAMPERNWAVFSEKDRGHTILYPDDLAFRKENYMMGIQKVQEYQRDCRYRFTYYWSEL